MNIAIKVILICFICLNMWVNIMVLALKSGPQIAAKTGNPAGLLFRQIWYSVGKSGVLGITEYRQGRPLVSVDVCVGDHVLVRCHHPPAVTRHRYVSESSRRVLGAPVIHRLHAGVARSTNRSANSSRIEQVRTSTSPVMV